MAMDSIKFRSVHLMDDGDGHHNFGIDGDGDGHHFKGDGRHVWLAVNLWSQNFIAERNFEHKCVTELKKE